MGHSGDAPWCALGNLTEMEVTVPLGISTKVVSLKATLFY